MSKVRAGSGPEPRAAAQSMTQDRALSTRHSLLSTQHSAPSTQHLAIVIVTYHSRALIGDCLRAIERAGQDCLPRVIVIDNASADGTADLVQESAPWVSLLRNAENRGFAAACNQGAAVADRPYLLFLNPDTVVQPAALGRTLELLADRPEVGAAGCQLLYPDGSFQHSAFRFPTLAMTFFDFFPIHHRLADSPLNGRYPRSRYRQSFPIDHPLGAFLLIRRSAWDEVGPLDEGYFMYVEEIDWCRRAKQAGHQVYCEPSATVIHHAGASTRQVRPAMLIQLYRSRLRYFAKFCPPAEQIGHRAIIATGCAARLRTATGTEAEAYRVIRDLCLAHNSQSADRAIPSPSGRGSG